MIYRLLQAALLAEKVGEMESDDDRVGPEPNRRPEGLLGFPDFFDARQDNSKVTKGVGKVGLETDRPPKGLSGLIHSTRSRQGIPQINVEPRRCRFNLHRSFKWFDRVCETTRRQQNQSQAMKGWGITGILRKYLPVSLFRLGKPARLQVLGPSIEELKDLHSPHRRSIGTTNVGPSESSKVDAIPAGLKRV
jgi:hypothetical protein